MVQALKQRSPDILAFLLDHTSCPIPSLDKAIKVLSTPAHVPIFEQFFAHPRVSMCRPSTLLPFAFSICTDCLAALNTSSSSMTSTMIQPSSPFSKRSSPFATTTFSG